jgi:hypothetical protein
MVSRVLARYSAVRVAARHEILRAAHEACQSASGIKMASGLDLERILVAMAEGVLIPDEGLPREASFTGLLHKFKQVVFSVKRFPQLWGKLKELLGVEGLGDLPGRIKELAREGFQVLKRAFTHAFRTWPLKLYSLPEAGLLSINKLLEKLVKSSPRFERFLRENVKPRIDQFDLWLRESLPTMSKMLMVSVYIFIWVNVVEFEWDMRALLSAATGHLSLADLLVSLPGSVIGFLMNSLGFGTFTLLPAALAARLLFVMGARYVVYNGGFKLNREKLQEDFGIEFANGGIQT